MLQQTHIDKHVISRLPPSKFALRPLVRHRLTHYYELS